MDGRGEGREIIYRAAARVNHAGAVNASELNSDANTLSTGRTVPIWRHHEGDLQDTVQPGWDPTLLQGPAASALPGE